MPGGVGDAAHYRKEKNSQQNARRASLWNFHDLTGAALGALSARDSH